MAEEISIDQFITLLKKSDVLSDKIIDELLAKFLPNGADDSVSAKRLAKSLIDCEALTEWQAKFLLTGRHRLKIGSHVLLERLGRDQFGDRFLAVHQSLKRKVVLEIFSKEVSSDQAKRKALLDKASMVSKLDHPNLVHVYDIDEEGDRIYVVVELVDGKVADITQSMNLEETEIASIIKSCASGLFYAHQHDVIHGSMLPEDLVLQKSGTVKIQNLSLSPLRITQQGDRIPSENDDFLGLSNIALKLLASNKSVTPHENRDQLKQIFAKFRKNPEVVAGELDQWIEANPSRSVSTAPQVVALPDSNGRTSGAHRLRKSGPNAVVGNGAGSDEVVASNPGYFVRMWQESPIKLIATFFVPFLLLNVIGLALIYQWTRPVAEGDPVAIDSGSRSAAMEAERQQRETSGDRTLTANDVNDPEKIRKLINERMANEEGGKEGGDSQTPAPDNGSKVATQPNANRSNSANTPKNAGTDVVDVNVKVPDNKAGNPQAQNSGGKQPGNGAGDGKDKVANNPSPPASPTIPKATKETADDLKKINGIGEAIERNLNGVGIKTYGQLAAMTPQDLNAIGKTFNRFGIPVADATRIVDQAKKLDAQTVSTGAKPPATAGSGGAPALDPSKPYANFPDRKNLPPIENTKQVVIAPLVIRPQYLLGLDIIAPEGIGRAKMIYELERKDEGKIQNWIVGVKRSERQKPEPIAMFTKTEDKFKFKWLDNAHKTKGAPELRNCFVKLHTPDDEATVLSLRAPVRVPPLRLDPETLKAEVKFDIEELPDPSKVRVEFQPIDQGEAYIDLGLPIAKPGENARVFFRDIKRNAVQADTLWVEMGAEFRSKFTVAAAVNINLGNQIPVVIQDYDALLTLQTQLDQARIFATQNASLKPSDKGLADKRSKAEADLSKMKAYVKGINRLREVPIDFRVVADFDGYQVVLAVSDRKLTEESFKEKNRAKDRRKDNSKSQAPDDSSKQPTGDAKSAEGK